LVHLLCFLSAKILFEPLGFRVLPLEILDVAKDTDSSADGGNDEGQNRRPISETVYAFW
jgi:hypothetical protein